MLHRQHPTVLGWPIMNENISTLLFNKTLTNTYRSYYRRDFRYFDSTVSSKVLSFRAEFDYVNMSSSDFCADNSVGSTRGLLHYYSGDLSQPYLENIVSLMNLTEILPDLQGVSANLWLGEKGVIAPIHYDSVYNAYIHLKGIKTFYLWSPCEYPNMELFGRHHPYSCQSRHRPFSIQSTTGGTRASLYARDPVHFRTEKKPSTDDDIDIEFTKTKPAVNLSNPIEIKLFPGDVLFIPAFWFHEVILYFLSYPCFYCCQL